jgi:hypothetical protein
MTVHERNSHNLRSACDLLRAARSAIHSRGPSRLRRGASRDF